MAKRCYPVGGPTPLEVLVHSLISIMLHNIIDSELFLSCWWASIVDNFNLVLKADTWTLHRKHWQFTFLDWQTLWYEIIMILATILHSKHHKASFTYQRLRHLESGITAHLKGLCEGGGTFPFCSHPLHLLSSRVFGTPQIASLPIMA